MFICKKRVTATLAIALLCSAATLCFVSDLRAETLQGAVQDAIQNHPQVEQALARIDAAKEERASERSGYFPEVSVSGTGGRIFGNNSTTRATSVTRSSTYSNFWEGSVSAQQPIFDGFETKSRVSAADASRRSADMSLLDVREQLALRTVQAYLNVAQARTTVDSLQEQHEKMNSYLGRIKAAVDQGAADDTEHQQALDIHIALHGFQVDAQGQLRAAESDFLELTGRMPEEEMEHPIFNLSAFPQSPQEAIHLAIQSHPSIQSAQFTAKSTEFDIDAEKASLYPTVDGELSYLESDKDEDIGGEITDARAVVRLNWNFETGGGQSARIRQKRNEYKEALAQEREIKRRIERDIRIAYAELETARDRLDNQKRRATLNKKLLATYDAQFEGGVVRLLQLMQAENQYFNAELEKTILQYRLLNAQYGILASTGRLQGSLLQTASLDETR